MIRRFAIWLAVLALWVGAPRCGTAAQTRKHSRSAPAPASSDGASSPPASGKAAVDKKRFETYLKQRLKKIKDAHQARLNFFDRESQDWKAFWEKIRDERSSFELRITRQTLDLFESLASLDSKDHSAAVSDFEKLQAGMTRAFELQQKQKMSDFFAEREARWKIFYGEQERERSEFMGDASARWQEDKETIKDGGGPPAAAKAPVEQAPPPETAPEPPKVEPAKNLGAPKPKPKPRMDVEDKWH